MHIYTHSIIYAHVIYLSCEEMATIVISFLCRPSKGSKRVPVHSIEKDGPIELEIVKGQQVQEARQTLADWSALVFR